MELKVLNDLNIAGTKEQIDSLIKIIGDYPIDDILTPKEFNEKGIENAISKKRRKMEIKEINSFLETGDLSKVKRSFDARQKDDDVIKAYYDDLAKKKGYQGIIDFNNTEFCDLPIAIFDRKKDLKTISNEKITQEDIDFADEILLGKRRS